MENVKLTKTVKKGGCAAKIGAPVLREILAGVQFPKPHPQLLVDGSTFDDAAVYQVTDDIALVQTLDFFTPIVNDPYTFGRVAAANALSDVYAMGGEPKTCLSILAYPLSAFEPSLIAAVLQGASDTVAESGANLVGGHSIDDETLKFGLCVTGYVHPKKIWSNAGARPGDILILSKPIGTGTLLAGLKTDAYSESDVEDALESMCRLNNLRSLLGDLDSAVHAATDVTGFGIAGHAMQMAQASQVTFSIDTGLVPVFKNTFESLERKHLTKAHTSNREYTSKVCRFEEDSEVHNLLMFDPQTSGGLLLSVDSQIGPTLLEVLKRDFRSASIIGRVEPKTSHALEFKRLPR